MISIQVTHLNQTDTTANAAATDVKGGVCIAIIAKSVIGEDLRWQADAIGRALRRRIAGWWCWAQSDLVRAQEGW